MTDVDAIAKENERLSKEIGVLQRAYATECENMCILQAENAKLREELAKARDPQRIGGQADRSSFVYAIEQLREFRWQHATNDEDAIPYINNVAAAHERESAKLRELAKEAMEVAHVLCGENLAPCDVCGVDKCGTGCKLECIDKLARELGIEVPS